VALVLWTLAPVETGVRRARQPAPPTDAMMPGGHPGLMPASGFVQFRPLLALKLAQSRLFARIPAELVVGSRRSAGEESTPGLGDLSLAGCWRLETEDSGVSLLTKPWPAQDLLASFPQADTHAFPLSTFYPFHLRSTARPPILSPSSSCNFLRTEQKGESVLLFNSTSRLCQARVHAHPESSRNWATIIPSASIFCGSIQASPFFAIRLVETCLFGPLHPVISVNGNSSDCRVKTAQLEVPSVSC
jgi:hypothetical protein